MRLTFKLSNDGNAIEQLTDIGLVQDEALYDYGMELTEEERADFKAQARFVRAYYYWLLLRKYGPVPILPDEGLDYTDSYDELARQRNSYDECADYIASEMALAAQDLPLTRGVNQISRPTRGAALAARARALLYAATAEEREVLAPQLVITYGGHIVSKRLKQWIRRLPEVIHWHISPDGDTPDVFCRLSAVFEMEPADFFRQLVPLLPQPGVTGSAYVEEWRRRNLTHPLPAFGYSEMGAVTELLERLARNTEGHVTVHLANSSTVRYAQLFPVGQRITVRCNRGVNGIEGSLSTAIGYAAASEDLNYILIGDLSFFYDMNALWNRHIRPNVRILLLNNGGGEIFQSLPGLSLSTQAHNLVTASHRTTARGWAEERGFAYQPVRNAHELDRAWADFTAPESDCPRLLEVFTDREEDIRQLKAYYHSLRRD